MSPLIVHHLGLSQSERIPWLCEELGLEYKLVRHTRQKNLLSPPSLTSIPGNDMGTAPVVQDGDLVMTESGAIADYIIEKYGDGKLSLRPDDPNYPHYLHWFHFANGTLQPSNAMKMIAEMAQLDPQNSVGKMLSGRLEKALKSIDKRLGETKAYLAGPDLTAADIMTFFSLANHRYFTPRSFEEYPNIVEYLQRVGSRKAYQKAMEKAEPGREILLGKDSPSKPGLLANL